MRWSGNSHKKITFEKQIERGEETKQTISGAYLSQSEGTANTQIPKSKWVDSCEQFVEGEKQKPTPIFKSFNFLVI